MESNIFKRNKLQKHKDLYYMYDSFCNFWIISDREDYTSANVGYYDGSMLITKCFEYFKRELENKL